MRKRIVSLLLVFCMTITFFPAGALAAETNGLSNTAAAQSQTVSALPFTDVQPSDWYYSAVKYARANGFFNGITETTFAPDGTLTRGMFVTVLGRMAGVDASAYQESTGFDDVSAGSYCAPYVKWAAKYGITSGAGNGLFLPDAPLTRQQMAAFLVRYFDTFSVSYETGENVTTQPADLDKVAGYAKDAVSKLWKQGLLNGNGVSFDPEGKATRAQTAAICMRTDKTVDSWYSEPGVKSDRVSVDPDAAQQPDDTKPTTKPTTSGGSSHGSSGGSSTTSYLVEFQLGDNDTAADMNMPESKTYPAGTPISQLPTPVKSGMVFLGWYYDKALTKGAESADTVDKSMTLYAKVAAGDEVSAIETPNYVTQSVDAGTYTFTLAGVDKADGAFKFINITGGNTDVDCKVIGLIVTAKLEAGQTYQVELTNSRARFALDGYGAEQLAAIRYLNILTAKNEVKNAQLNAGVKQVDVGATDGLSDSVFKGLYQVGDDGVTTQNAERGTFTYTGGTLKIGDVLAVKEGNVDLSDVSSTDGDVAYIKITAVNGENRYSYEMADVDDVLFMPDVLPVQNDWDKDKTDGQVLTITAQNLDAAMSKVDAKSLDEGDFIGFTDASNAEPTEYGKIESFTTNSDGDYVIKYTSAEEKDIENSLDVYYTQDQDIELSDAEKQEITDSIQQDFADNEVAEQTAAYLAAVMTESGNLETVPDMEAVAQRLESTQIVRTPTGVYARASGSKAKVNFDRNKIKVYLSANRQLDHLQGRGFKVTVNVPFNIELGNNISIDVTAAFDEEVILRQNISTKRHKTGFLKYDYSLNAAFEVGNYTGIGFTAKMSTTDGGETENMIDKLSEIMDEMKEYAEKPNGITSTGGEMESLSEIYQEVMQGADDTWIDLFDVKLFENNGNAFLHIFCWQVKGSFVVSANLAVSLGMSFDYTTQKRYNFSVRVKSRQTTNQTIDIITPQYNFDFYVVGTIGVRAGLRLEMYVGLFSLKLDKIGITADVGAYAQLWGYFFYHLEWKQGAGKKTNSAGAMMIEIGMYLDIKFVAQAFSSSKLTWNPTLYANQWPLWTAGEQQNVYAFADTENTDYTFKTAKTMTLPASTYTMSFMDLKNGTIGTVNKDSSKGGKDEQNFYITFSNPSFTYDAANNTVTVKPVTAGSLKEETDMTITWKKAALSFNSTPIRKVLHIEWSDPEGARYISFDSKGGSAVSQLTGGEGQALTWPADPVKQGYVFEGWYRDENCQTKAETLTTMPSFTGSDKGMTLYAKWRPDETKYVVEYYQEQLIDDKNKVSDLYAKVESESLTGKTDTEAVVPVKEYPGFTAQPVEQKTIAPDGSTVVKVYYDRNSYDVKFVLENGMEDIVKRYKYAETLTAPNASRSGYTFEGWGTTLPKTVESDAEYTAQWTANDNAVTFETDGGTEVAGQTVKTDEKITKPSDPEKIGYDFGGWYTDQSCTKAWNFENDTVSDAVTLYAKWTAKTYDVTLNFNDEGAHEPENIQVTYGGTYAALPTPKRAGYKFLGWFTAQTDGDEVKAEDKVSITADQTLYAHWKEGEAKYTVKHYQQNITDNEYTEVESETLTGITGQQTKAEAKTYTGFAEAKAFEQQTIKADGSTEIEIKYDRLTYTVTWMNDTETLDTETLRYGATPEYSGETPVKKGTGHKYGFTGWSPEISEVTKNATYKAQFSDEFESYSITYKLNSGTNASGNPERYTYNTAVTLADPTRTGYTFDGWFTNSGFSGDKVTAIPAGETGDKTFYAKWTANTYTVTFDANEGTVTPESKTVTYDGNYGELPTPKRSGFKFLGWFTDLTGTDKVTADDKVSITADQTLYAHWDTDETQYPLWVNGIRVTAQNADDVFKDGKVSYDAGTNTLTLNNYSITATDLTAGSNNKVTAVIKYWDGFYQDDKRKTPLNLVLNGTNKILNAMSDTNVNVGIYTLGDLNISGNGSLEVRGGLGNSNTKITKSYGMYLEGNLTINSGKIHAYSTQETLSYDGGDEMACCECYGIYVMRDAISGDMIVNGGTVVAEGTPNINSKSTGASATGVSGGIFVQNKLTINDGNVTANGADSITVSGKSGSFNQASSVGVALKHLAINGGSLSANSKKVRDNTSLVDRSYGIWSYDTFSSDGIKASITISDGSVHATSGDIAVSATNLSLADGVAAQVSTDENGADPTDYTSDMNLKTYKWFSAN